MAQDGDTVTYSFSGGASVAEDVSAVSTALVEYVDGAGATDDAPGGRVENAVIDVSNHDTLYIWVGGSDSDSFGRYDGGSGIISITGGSTEISFINTDAADSSDEPFLVAAGSGGTPFNTTSPLSGEDDTISTGGARGGTGYGSVGDDGEGNPPPLGGDGAVDSSSQPQPGDGAIDDQNRGLVSGGTTIEGGGAATDGEIQITYQSGPEPPAAPTNLTASIN